MSKEQFPASVQNEIESLRGVLKRLLDSFSRVETIKACPERSRRKQFKLSSAINLTTASIYRLARTQHYFQSHRASLFDQSVDQAINEVLKEWGRI